jgi:Uma2 family endonuclease
MGSVPSPVRLSIEEYLELDLRSEFPIEFVDGYIVEMSGGTLDHSRILGNALLALSSSFKDRQCEAFTAAKVWIPAVRSFCYPDVFVICGSPRFRGDRKDVVENPSVIVEVLSESTRGYDHDQKFRRYRMIPELKQYVLISQDSAFVEVFSRSEQGFWVLREYQGLDASIELDAIGVKLPLEAVYRGVDFPVVES